MTKHGNQLKLLSNFFVVLLALLPLMASSQTKTTSKKKANSKTNTTLTTKKVELEQASHNFEITTHDGSAVALPVVNKTLVDQSSILPMSDNLLADAGISKSMTVLKEKLIEQKEMQELSQRLGVSITDPNHLDLYREAADWLGTRYRRGGMSRQAVDCSGFTNLIYKNVYDKQLDRVSTTIAKNVKEVVAKDDLEPGDLVFFSTFNKKYINHVGVYLGEGKFIHASIKRGVIVSTLLDGYYNKAWRKGGRN